MKTLWWLSLFLCQNMRRSDWGIVIRTSDWGSRSIAFSLQYLAGKQFYFWQKYWINILYWQLMAAYKDNFLNLRKGICYQTTRVKHWNPLKITSANAIMWCDIFHLLVGRNKKRKPSMEGNYWLNINIQGHIADLYCLFRYLKAFLLTLISLYKNIFLFFLFLDGKICFFHERDIDFAEGIVFLVL